jgi:hypothetical protein
MFYPYCDPDEPSCYTPVALGMGIYCISASLLQLLWACFSIVIDNEIQGTSWGLLFCIENIAFVIFPLVVGEIHDIFIAHAPNHVRSQYSKEQNAYF